MILFYPFEMLLFFKSLTSVISHDLGYKDLGAMPLTCAPIFLPL